ncbi:MULTISPECIES: KilA-N domain-containing protein [unclassified Halomonas]|uniref:KilA-N domain-containing protein n=1 Tax=unclassified Halomonas TaxID=2609666 RepID=UPI002888C408|nr:MULTISPECIES: KilA-N domain-containing protein [unclassified Halomonas]MDT0500315.1 KilA-N domain-containing protein [Halomonas sp. PAR7]MDT0511188.1 KilA-N domain-containing protein [Halomonas sp. LES1]MDT0590523.1 KilA-N domain-containing protein [Halomonas sp. PAR8]
MSNQLIYREYNGFVFTFREDGYFNMTKAAKAIGKNVNEFLRLPSTSEYLDALYGIIPDKDLVDVKRGSGLLPHVGTWGHSKLAVFFARWLDPKFTVNRITLGLATQKTYVG